MRSSNGYSNESLESLNLSSEDAESDREMDIEEEDLEDHAKEVDEEENIDGEIEPWTLFERKKDQSTYNIG